MSFQKTINDIKDGNIPTNLNRLKRRLWPNYCYHFTNIDNAIQILQAGYLYSRKRAISLGIMRNENANQDIIANTQPKVFDYARLYFRPQAPTLFDNEGFRAQKAYKHARCPFPIYFLFSLSDVLNLPTSYFSSVSLATHQKPVFLSSETDFSELPFNLIYNDSRFTRAERDNIVRHEQAEIIVKSQLSLSYLQKIVVRSVAEKDTLDQLLKNAGLTNFLDQIEIDEDGSFFFKRWTYMDDVTMNSDNIKLSMRVGQDAFPTDWGNSPRAIVPESHELYLNYRVVIIDSNNREWYWPNPAKVNALPQNLTLSLKNINDDNYTVKVYLDGQLAYFGRHDEFSDLPF
ncbi:hypothetical protein YK48G_14480 [Lentilactobacillus fungorum]|uniref:DarT domain-containing protein n=1 Tax=Lentilactobacillus fungorum TaxID=2201250 RepID=A0ABQ3VZ71_9LACO|nr:DarT ssDNA thymidine ADP-ribosyltransferase family protein [Lentilactobacillus fungorum]GHP14023.1 hypothetical protein YK48G_14480 [Lentilactobacillus fungorum]